MKEREREIELFFSCSCRTQENVEIERVKPTNHGSPLSVFTPIQNTPKVAGKTAISAFFNIIVCLSSRKKNEKSLNSVRILILCAVLQLQRKHRHHLTVLIVILVESGKIFDLFLRKKLFIQLFVALFKSIFQNNRLSCISPIL
jgi:hypothetical protein